MSQLNAASSHSGGGGVDRTKRQDVDVNPVNSVRRRRQNCSPPRRNDGSFYQQNTNTDKRVDENTHQQDKRATAANSRDDAQPRQREVRTAASDKVEAGEGDASSSPVDAGGGLSFRECFKWMHGGHPRRGSSTVTFSINLCPADYPNDVYNKLLRCVENNDGCKQFAAHFDQEIAKQKQRSNNRCIICSVLNLVDTRLEESGLRLILKCFDRHRIPIRIYKLYKARIDDEMCHVLADHLSKVLQPISELHLTDNKITDAGCLTLMKAFKKRELFYPRVGRGVVDGGGGGKKDCRVPLWLRLQNNYITNWPDIVDRLGFEPSDFCFGKKENGCGPQECGKRSNGNIVAKFHIPFLQRQCDSRTTRIRPFSRIVPTRTRSRLNVSPSESNDKPSEREDEETYYSACDSESELHSVRKK